MGRKTRRRQRQYLYSGWSRETFCAFVRSRCLDVFWNNPQVVSCPVPCTGVYGGQNEVLLLQNYRISESGGYIITLFGI